MMATCPKQSRQSFIIANAGIDQSSVAGDDEHALVLPVDPDGTASSLHVMSRPK